jgi:hypothetical protein
MCRGCAASALTGGHPRCVKAPDSAVGGTGGTRCDCPAANGKTILMTESCAQERVGKAPGRRWPEPGKANRPPPTPKSARTWPVQKRALVLAASRAAFIAALIVS